MVCKNCKEKPVIKLTNNNIYLCKNCFIRYFEKKVKKTISDYSLVSKNDHIVVATSGGKDSTSLLYLLNTLFEKRKDIRITALAIDEGIQGYRDENLEFLKRFCKKYKINLEICSFNEEFGKSLDNILKSYNGIPCSICGVLRRYLLNSKARKLKATKLATGHNMDDEAQSILMNIFRSNMKVSARLGPLTGIKDNKKFIRRIKPLYFLTEKEVTTYAFLKGFMDKLNECPYCDEAYRNEIRLIINDFEAKYPGTKHAIINSFIEIMPILKKHYSKNSISLKTCEKCGEACSKTICKACEFIKNEFQ